MASRLDHVDLIVAVATLAAVHPLEHAAGVRTAARTSMDVVGLRDDRADLVVDRVAFHALELRLDREIDAAVGLDLPLRERVRREDAEPILEGEALLGPPAHRRCDVDR